jgi:hypothetical protein
MGEYNSAEKKRIMYCDVTESVTGILTKLSVPPFGP